MPDSNLRLRPTEPADSRPLLALAEATGFFKPIEIQALGEVLDDYHAANQAAGHRSITCETDAGLAGFVYFAPAAMTDRAWYLYWIAVDRRRQGQGIGGVLLARAEDDIRLQGGRLLLIETSSLAHYEPTRRFYLKHAYQHAATLADFYADGDDMVVYRKRL